MTAVLESLKGWQGSSVPSSVPVARTGLSHRFSSEVILSKELRFTATWWKKGHCCTASKGWFLSVVKYQWLCQTIYQLAFIRC